MPAHRLLRRLPRRLPRSPALPTLPTLPTLLTLAALLAAPAAWGQGSIYRCGNEYTNDAHQAQRRGCALVDAGPVTVPGTRVQRLEPAAASGRPPAPVPATATAAPPAAGAPAAERGHRITAAEQRARDTDARAILQAELRKAQAQLAQLQAEYKDGQPDHQGIEGRNHARYLERVQALRDALVRQQADVDSLQRELSRLPGTAEVAATP